MYLNTSRETYIVLYILDIKGTNSNLFNTYLIYYKKNVSIMTGAVLKITENRWLAILRKNIN